MIQWIGIYSSKNRDYATFCQKKYMLPKKNRTIFRNPYVYKKYKILKFKTLTRLVWKLYWWKRKLKNAFYSNFLYPITLCPGNSQKLQKVIPLLCIFNIILKMVYIYNKWYQIFNCQWVNYSWIRNYQLLLTMMLANFVSE